MGKTVEARKGVKQRRTIFFAKGTQWDNIPCKPGGEKETIAQQEFYWAQFKKHEGWGNTNSTRVDLTRKKVAGQVGRKGKGAIEESKGKAIRRVLFPEKM